VFRTRATTASPIEVVESYSTTAFNIDKPLRNEVHIWHIDLTEVLSSRLGTRLLSEDELEKAGRFAFPRDRQRYIAGRAALRIILGRYLDIAPDRVRFSYGANGKPTVIEPQTEISFNLSNSSDVAVAAVSVFARIGIDLEKIDSGVNGSDLAAQFFTAYELASITAVPQENRQVRFLEFWTRKEAFVKALGVGVSVSLDQFEVSEWKDQSTLQVSGFEGTWFFRQFVPQRGYIAALIVEARPARLLWLRFP
jgi:4'-phosphopantetheinyl transferase